jgi:hypothetical protein
VGAKCYKLFPAGGSSAWCTAACATAGASLPCVTDQTENDYLDSIAAYSPLFGVWIGLRGNFSSGGNTVGSGIGSAGPPPIWPPACTATYEPPNVVSAADNSNYAVREVGLWEQVEEASCVCEKPTALLASTYSRTFLYTGQMQNFTVPVGMSSLTATLYGASGGISGGSSGVVGGSLGEPVFLGGKGGMVRKTMSNVAAGTVLYIFVGGQGMTGEVPSGYNGGGESTFSMSGAGGGATDIRIGSTTLASRKLVAGGGGGGEYNDCLGSGGFGGYPAGGPGLQDGCDGVTSTGGNQTHGGLGSGFVDYEAEYRGGSGALGLGGPGCTTAVGAGGGGGYYGGGGTCGGGGGGGGSSYSFYTDSTFLNGVHSGDGYVVLDFVPAPPTAAPTGAPSVIPTSPTVAPSAAPTAPTAVPTVAPTVSCPSGWVGFGSNCYQLFGPPMNSTSCQAYCASLSASMLCIQDEIQNNFVGTRITTASAWIGISNAGTWVPGCTSTYLNWGISQPEPVYTSTAIINSSKLWVTRPGVLVTGCPCQVVAGTADPSSPLIALPTLSPSASPTTKTPTETPSAVPTTASPSAAPTQNVVCPHGWISFGLTCYYMSGMLDAGQACRSRCETLDAQMLCPLGAQQNAFAARRAQVSGLPVLTGWTSTPAAPEELAWKGGGECNTQYTNNVAPVLSDGYLAVSSDESWVPEQTNATECVCQTEATLLGGVPRVTTFPYTGHVQKYIVPRDTASLRITLYGASGGSFGGYQGGKGAVVIANVTGAEFPAGAVLYVYAGGAGVLGKPMGGFNGGGNGTGVYNVLPGGGATDIRYPFQSVADRLLVAGGGGGGDKPNACGAKGGAGGTPDGGAGTRTLINSVCANVTSATGGTREDAGTGGIRIGMGVGSTGSLWAGGAGCTAATGDVGGAGGGGGYYGGGGSCGGGAGGGSSYSVYRDVAYAPATAAGNGYVVIEYFPIIPTAVPTPAPSTVAPTAAPTGVCPVGWVSSSQDCIKLGAAMSLIACKDSCVALAATMLCVGGNVYNTKLAQKLLPYTPSAWIGMSAQGQWYSSCTSNFTKWQDGQPANINTNAVLMTATAEWTTLSTTEKASCPCRRVAGTGEPSVAPSGLPTPLPTTAPPSALPSRCPTAAPSAAPTLGPSSAPTVVPTCLLSVLPTVLPSRGPTVAPSGDPSAKPSVMPSAAPTPAPSAYPTLTPSSGPTVTQSTYPTLTPSTVPTITPSAHPTPAPSTVPTATPSARPTPAPSTAPTVTPSAHPTPAPSTAPTVTPSAHPTPTPSTAPTATPSAPPTLAPTTVLPTTAAPSTAVPTTAAPSTADPTTAAPSTAVSTTALPTTAAPTTAVPTTALPTTVAPSTAAPTTALPTTAAPSSAVPTTALPSTSTPSTAPPTSLSPTNSTDLSAEVPTGVPSTSPTEGVGAAPATLLPTSPTPTNDPTHSPSVEPSAAPTTLFPTVQPTLSPSVAPACSPTRAPSAPIIYDEVTVFNYSGDVQYYTVPKRVIALEVAVIGASGSDAGAFRGGRGAKVKATFAVSTGQVIYIHVGGRPERAQTQMLAVGDYNGGGEATSTFASMGAGGGSSDIRLGKDDLEHRVLVAGGGGGGDSFCGGNGGDGGFPAGKPGEFSVDCGYVQSAGAGGDQLSGGAAGVTNAYSGDTGGGVVFYPLPILLPPPVLILPQPIQIMPLPVQAEPVGEVHTNMVAVPIGGEAVAGSFGYGGIGCYAGGGGGYYGGGGACGGGGGGGSSYSAYPSAVFTDAVNVGDGQVVVRYIEFAPTATPTPLPTKFPTVVPSQRPTTGPTTAPSAEPSIRPTTLPTAEPTVAPSASPSTALPMHTPTCAPTVAPSVPPTGPPTVVPTVGPTAGPSASPSAAPTVVPSNAPTRRPTASPSTRPSAAPTLLPTVAPSCAPTLAVGETRKPTVAPSLSVAPTAAPSASAETQWRLALSDTLSARAAAKPSDVTYRATYLELDVAMSTPTNLLGSCAGWKSLLSGELATSRLLYETRSVDITVQSSLTSPPSTVSCDTKSEADAILAALQAANLGAAVTTTCGDHKWVVKSCSGVSSVCVDCTDPCATSAHCPSSGAGAYTIAPCVSASCTSGAPVASSLRLLAVNFKDAEPSPAFVTRSVAGAKTSLQVTAVLASRGTVYCAAYPVDPQSGVSAIPTSTASVLLQNFGASTNAANVSVVSLTGLNAATGYVLYCLAQSPSGTQTALSDIISSAQVYTTSCCIEAVVRAAASSVKDATSSANFVTLTVAARPAESIALYLHAYKVNVGGGVSPVSPPPFFPPTFTVPALSSGSSASSVTLTAALLPLSAGSYVYNVSVSGPSAYQYEVRYVAADRSLTVLPATAPLPAPKLSAAVFSSDGSNVVISFDSNTDRGGVGAAFTCSSLFSFACATTSACKWTSDTTVTVIVDTSPLCIAMGGRISLAPSAQLKALCTSANCDTSAWSVASASAGVNLTAPAVAVVPTVAISSPTTIGECDSLTLDITSSTGSGGRAWASRTIRVESTASVNTTLLQSFLSSRYQQSPPTPIPSSMLAKGQAYTFKVTLCNFLGKCGQASKRVLVQATTVPVVSLPGSSLRRSKRSTALSVGSEAFYVECSSAAVVRTGLGYTWIVSTAGVQLLNVDTSSRDPSKLLLPALSLQANVLYDISLKVTITATQQSATAVLQVFVEAGDVVPVVALGSSRTVRVDQSIDIDASGSYDQDQSGVKGTAAGLTFSWSCVQTAPVFASTCADALSSAASPPSQPGIFSLTARSAAADAVVQVTVTIADVSNSRTASSAVTVTVLPSLAPVVSVTASSATGVVNANQPLSLAGSVSLPVGFNGTATWSAPDTGSFKLSQATQSALVNYISPVPTAVLTKVYLALAANTLPPGLTLTFSLTARTPLNGIQSVATVAVTVNAPPQPGSFRVAPSSGEELVESFSFLAERWTDADLPLLYQFSYLTAEGVEVTLRSKAESAFTSAVLPAGPASSNYSVVGTAQVFDGLAASSSVQYTVRVTKAVAVRSAASTSDFVTSSLSSSGGNVDQLKRATALSSYLLNQVDCSGAPDCAKLNRAGCSQTPQTCGVCVTSLYVGEVGDSNEPCILKSAVSHRRLGDVGSACLVAGNCGAFQTCDQGRCSGVLKQCKANCTTSNGACVFVGSDSGVPVPSCFVGDPMCRAVCNCTAAYIGSETCSLNSTELQLKQALRAQVVQGVHSILRLEDADQDTVTGWINTLKVASQVPDELSEDSIGSLWQALKTVQQYSTTSQLGVSALSGILSTVNAAAQAVADSRAPGRRRRLLSAEGVDSSKSFAMQATEALASFQDYAASQLLPGQDPVRAVYPQFRLHVENVALTGQTDIAVQLPVTALEELSGTPSASVRLPADSEDSSSAGAVAVSLSTVRSQLFNQELGLTGYDQLYSNPLTVNFGGLTCADEADCTFEVELPTESLSDALQVRTPDEYFNTTCAAGDYNAKYHTCATGDIVAVPCDGREAVGTVQCPVKYLSPACNALMGLVIGESACTLKAHTYTSITCSCPVRSALRRALSDNSTVDAATVSIGYVAMLTEVKDAFVATLLSTQGMGLDTLRKGWSVLVTIGVFAAVVLFGLHWSYKVDLEANKVKPTMKEKASKVTPAAKLERRKVAWKKQRAKGAAGGDLRIAEEALPLILSSGTLTSKVADEMKHHHKWFGIIFYYSKSFPRVLRVISLATNVLIMLFIQSLTYALTNPDDGSCEALTSEQACLEPASPYATGESKCYWNPQSTGQKCLLVQPDSNDMVIVFVAVFSALVSTPLALLVDWVVLHVLASPLKTPAPARARTVSADSAAPVVRETLTGIFFGGERSSKVAPAGIVRKRGGNFRLSSLFGFENTSAVAAQNTAKLLAQTDMRVMLNKIVAYRAGLTPAHRDEFDGEITFLHLSLCLLLVHVVCTVR